jgi:sec-independent protein translocase protein TatC
MPEPREDDLFRESTMTFGEHLEDLRACLLKSIYGLVLGFIVGLIAGPYVVSFIQQPLTKALSRYYQEESEQRVNDSGQASPWTKDQVKDFVEKEKLLADEVYVDPTQMLQALRNAYPKEFKDLQLPPQTRKSDGAENGNFIRLFL